MSWNESIHLNNTSNSIINILHFVKQEFLVYLPLIFFIFGIIGFIGNAFTFLQPCLRFNTCCIYLLGGSLVDVINLSINLLSNYIYAVDNLVTLVTDRYVCKWKLFGLVFLPQLSMNLLALSLIDRYACTCSLASSIRQIRRIKMVPWMIIITTIISGTLSFYAPLLHDIVSGFGCTSINPLLNGVLYIILHGFVTPIVMLIFLLLTYRNVQQSRRRAGSKNLVNIDRSRNPFLRMIFTQVFTTSLLSLQWISFYTYHIITLYHQRSNEQQILHYFIWCISNNVYYLINIKSFYLSTLTSRLFRETFFKALFRLLSCYRQKQTSIKLPGSSMNIPSKSQPDDRSQCEFEMMLERNLF